MRKPKQYDADGLDQSGVVKQTTAIDVYVGQRVRLRRAMLGMSQEELADALGVSYQQVQKYERGETRITVARLYEMASFMEVQFDWFIDGLENAVPAGSEVSAGLGSAADRQSLDLMRLFSNVSDDRLRRRLLRMMKAFLEAEPEPKD